MTVETITLKEKKPFFKRLEKELRLKNNARIKVIHTPVGVILLKPFKSATDMLKELLPTTANSSNAWDEKEYVENILNRTSR